MARQASTARLGFYPINPNVTALICEHLRADPNAVILDPCCGEGTALHQIQRALDLQFSRTFGIELDEGRTAKAKVVAPRTLGPADFHAVAITPGCISLAYLNPPFDDELGGGRREELAFLVKTTRILKAGGVLVMVLPVGTIHNSDVCKHLDTWYDRTALLTFPDEHRDYSEVLVFGVRRKHATDPAGGFMQTIRWQSWKWPTLGDRTFSDVYHVPPGDIPRRFEKTGYTETELIRELRVSPLVEAAFGDPRDVEPRQPSLPVRHGQVILTLVSGRLDGVVRPEGEPPHVVRGTCKKVPYTAEDEDTLNKEGDVTGHKTVIKEDAVSTCRIVPHDFSAVLNFSSATPNPPQETPT